MDLDRRRVKRCGLPTVRGARQDTSHPISLAIRSIPHRLPAVQVCENASLVALTGVDQNDGPAGRTPMPRGAWAPEPGPFTNNRCTTCPNTE